MYRNEEFPPLYRWDIFRKFSESVETGITTRLGGFSRDQWSTFNQALHCGDDRETVVENRRLLCRTLGIPFDQYTCAEQVHGTTAALVAAGQTGSGRETYESSIGSTDALVVKDRGIFINIHLADCVPIVLFDRVQSAGAVVHAGWKGTAGLITLKTVRFMVEKLGSDPADIIAGIGPSIGQCCFEIGKDTADRIRESFSYSEVVVREKDGIYNADLKEANCQQLISSGIRERNIEVSEICTSCSQKEFYSHRGEGGKTGRFAAFLMIK